MIIKSEVQILLKNVTFRNSWRDERCFPDMHGCVAAPRVHGESTHKIRCAHRLCWLKNA
jgi:hypothetical protein